MAVKHALVSGKGDGSDAALVRASNWNADHLVDVFAPSGLTGATTAARFVGGTVSGAPITGTFAVNDFVIAQDGKVWLCTSAGSPGVWAQVGGAADIVQGMSGGGNTTIPGFLVADRLPASPSAYDDEFNTTLSGWTTLGTLDTSDANVTPSQCHLKKNSSGGWFLYGIYKAIPAPPFTVTTHISACLLSGVYHRYGLMLLEATPGKILEFGNMYWTSGQDNCGYGVWTNQTSRASWSGDVPIPAASHPSFIRMIVVSYGTVTLQTSINGLVWRTCWTSISPGFAFGNVGFVATAENGDLVLDAYFDWIRFTLPSYMDAIPIMTSATAPSGVVSASSSYSTTPAWHAFDQSNPSDGDSGHGWITNGTSTGWLRYQFPSAVTALGYAIRPWWCDTYPGRTPKTWTFEGSNNGSSWTTLDTQTNWASANSTDWVYFPVASPGSYLYYQLNVSANNGDGYMGVGNFQIYVAR